jgi:hypothetical protein
MAIQTYFAKKTDGWKKREKKAAFFLFLLQPDSARKRTPLPLFLESALADEKNIFENFRPKKSFFGVEFGDEIRVKVNLLSKVSFFFSLSSLSLSLPSLSLSSLSLSRSHPQ